MNLAALEDFLAVADCNTLTLAAERRNISISAFSRRLSSLEDWLGVELVDRGKRPNELTYAGLLFREVALNVLSSLQEIRETIRRDIPGQNILTFALPHNLREKFFPEFLSRSNSTGVVFEAQLLIGTEAARLREIIEKGACHFLIYYSWPDLPFELPAGYTFLCLAEDRLVPVSLPDEQGGPRFPVPGRADGYTPYLSQGPGSYFMQIVGDLVRKFGHAHFLKQVSHAEGSEPLIHSVREGKGMAWLPGHLVEEDLRSGRLVLAGSPKWIIPLQIRIARGVVPIPSCGEKLWKELGQEDLIKTSS
jgi:DNA-binding transcriptional LysR family regulator